MTEQKFKSEMRRAETMRGLADPMMAEYWAGYIRGLRRAYHGEKFGTDDEHEKCLSAANSRDESRKQRGRGYKDGLVFGDCTGSWGDSNITTTTDIKQGRLYAGPSLPEGAKIIGTVTRDGYDTGALVELANGREVQYNAGVIRNLPSEWVRKLIIDNL